MRRVTERLKMRGRGGSNVRRTGRMGAKMRTYSEAKEAVLISTVCNCCGRELSIENGILKEESIEFKHTFGYFSEKDGQTEEFDLCEACYQKIIGKFQIPVKGRTELELL